MKSTAPIIAGGVALVAAIVGLFFYNSTMEPATPQGENNFQPSALVDQGQKAKQPVADPGEKAEEAKSDKAAPNQPATEDKMAVMQDKVGANKTEDAQPASDTAAQVKPNEAKTAENKTDKAAGKDEMATGSIVPSFDVVRVEPDGNTLVAGRAAPGAMVELRDGDKVLSHAKANEHGEWVMVLDELLKQGVSDLSLAAKADENSEPALSKGSVTVALPKDGKGELLVIETEPGQASKILALTSDDSKKAEAKKAAEEKVKADADVAKAAEETKVKAEAEMAAKTAEEEKAKAAAEAAAKVEAAKAKETEMKAAEAQAKATAEAEAAKASEAKAEVEAEAPKEAAIAASHIAIEAVELEGDTVFVAGEAKPSGALLRLYVDNKVIADTKSGETERFLFDSAIQLEPGEHDLRVDLIGGGDGAVLKRAEVTFAKKASDAPKVAAKDGEVSMPSKTAEAKPVDQGKAGSNAAPAVANQSNKVIIRRGDNLWEIARRVYGAGIRYSTIYDSNNDQIRDPHWIYPGQVFQLPEGQEGWERNFDAVDRPEPSAQ